MMNINAIRFCALTFALIPSSILSAATIGKVGLQPVLQPVAVPLQAPAFSNGLPAALILGNNAVVQPPSDGGRFPAEAVFGGSKFIGAAHQAMVVGDIGAAQYQLGKLFGEDYVARGWTIASPVKSAAVEAASRRSSALSRGGGRIGGGSGAGSANGGGAFGGMDPVEAPKEFKVPEWFKSEHLTIDQFERMGEAVSLILTDGADGRLAIGKAVPGDTEGSPAVFYSQSSRQTPQLYALKNLKDENLQVLIGMIQGAMNLSKNKKARAAAQELIDHVRSYIKHGTPPSANEGEWY